MSSIYELFTTERYDGRGPEEKNSDFIRKVFITKQEELRESRCNVVGWECFKDSLDVPFVVRGRTVHSFGSKVP